MMVKALLLMMLGACPTEDSSNCLWDAQTRGNLRGSSFLTLGDTVLPLGLLDTH